MTHEELHSLLTQAEETETQGRYEEAEELSKQVLLSLAGEEAAGESGTEQRTIKAGATRMLGVVLWRHGDYATALEHLHAALLVSEEIHDSAGIARALGNIGTVHLSLSDYPKALEYYTKALAIDEELGNKSGVARHLGTIGLVHSNLSDYPKALEYYTKALTIDEELEHKSGVAGHLGNIGNVHSDLSDYPKALEYYTKALAIEEERFNKRGVAKNLGNIGIVHSSLSDYPKALEYYSKALAIDEELGRKSGVAAHLGNIGNVHSNLSDYPKALEYYTKALAIDEERFNKRGVALWLGNIGIAHVNLSDYPKALEYYSKALAIDEERFNKSGVASHLINIGVVHERHKDYNRALEYYYRGLQMLEELGEKSEEANARSNIGGLYASVEWTGRDEAKAEAFLLESIAVSEALGTKRFEAHKSLAALYEKQERWRESNIQLQKYHELKEEVQSEEAKKQASQMEQQRQIAEREKEIAIAKAAADAQMSATTELLHKVLPQSIAVRLIKGEKIADYFAQISILFADIVGFTPIASRMSARAVLAFLNYVFGEFDRIVEKHGCEKIKTIGDGYLAVAGAPIECADHAERISRAAIDMMGDMVLPDDVRKTLPKDAHFSIRIGIHTGSCFGGIVGENRFVYDIYSDAVNTAARMESHGVPGRIQCSHDFVHHLQNRDESLVFEERGEIEIKGKGMMRTYFLEKA